MLRHTHKEYGRRIKAGKLSLKRKRWKGSGRRKDVGCWMECEEKVENFSAEDTYG